MRPGRPPTRPTTRLSGWCKPTPDPHEIRVVTSDKGLTDRVATLGASVYPAASFRDLIDPRG